MNMKLLLVMSLGAVLSFPQSKTQKAHVHGLAQINIALEGLKGEVEFEAPAAGVVGFEHEAKTAAQKKSVNDALNVLRTKGHELVQFPAAAGCKLTPKEVEVHREGAQHSEIHAHYDLACAKAPTGAISFGATKLFPGTIEVKVQFVSDKTQKSVTVVKDAAKLTL
jgi:hypothetical protein